MKDGLKQEICVGDKVVWVGGKTQYGGVHLYEVIKITEKRVRIKLTNRKNAPDLQTREPVIDPTDIVVVNKLLEDEQ